MQEPRILYNFPFRCDSETRKKKTLYITSSACQEIIDISFFFLTPIYVESHGSYIGIRVLRLLDRQTFEPRRPPGPTERPSVEKIQRSPIYVHYKEQESSLCRPPPRSSSTLQYVVEKATANSDSFWVVISKNSFTLTDLKFKRF